MPQAEGEAAERCINSGASPTVATRQLPLGGSN